MRVDTEQQMLSFDSAKGDRIDPVATLCRQLFLRTELCPCMQRPMCRQCENNREIIQEVWDATTLPKRPNQEWKVVFDGPSLAMISAPDGRIFSLRELGVQGKQWGNAEDNDQLCERIVAALREHPVHDLYKTGDKGVPTVICDSNGEVTLGLCKRCGKAEADLAGPCSKDVEMG